PPTEFRRSTPAGYVPRLALKPFRRERAISRFDQTFTPPHGSSPSFSTLVGSVLHGLLRPLQPAPGSLPWFRVSRGRQIRPVQTRFPWGSPPEGVNRAGHENSPDHYAKGTRSR